MNLKSAHLVSVQFGIFIGIVICLVFLHFENRLRTATETREPSTERVAAVAPKSAPKDERTQDYRDDLEPAESLTEQSIPAMPTEYSPEAVEKSMAILTKLYYEQISPRRTAGSNPPTSSLAAVAPAYMEVAPEPAPVQVVDPVPQPVAYVEPAPGIVYPQPAVVVYSYPRRLANRCRPAPQPNAFASNLHPRRDTITHLSPLPAPTSPRSPVLQQPRTTSAPNCPSPRGFTPRGKR